MKRADMPREPQPWKHFWAGVPIVITGRIPPAGSNSTADRGHRG